MVLLSNLKILQDKDISLKVRIKSKILMRGDKHLLSDSAEWMTNSEFVDKSGNIFSAIGEAKIMVSKGMISNESWTCIDGKRVCNCYKIDKETESRYRFECDNTAPGKQTGDLLIPGRVLLKIFQYPIKNDKLVELFTKSYKLKLKI